MNRYESNTKEFGSGERRLQRRGARDCAARNDTLAPTASSAPGLLWGDTSHGWTETVGEMFPHTRAGTRGGMDTGDECGVGPGSLGKVMTSDRCDLIGTATCHLLLATSPPGPSIPNNTSARTTIGTMQCQSDAGQTRRELVLRRRRPTRQHRPLPLLSLRARLHPPHVSPHTPGHAHSPRFQPD